MERTDPRYFKFHDKCPNPEGSVKCREFKHKVCTLCRSCSNTLTSKRKAHSKLLKERGRWLGSDNPSKGGVWNKGVSRPDEVKQKISDTIKANGGREGKANSNFGKFKTYTQSNKEYRQRVIVLTERVKHQIPGFDENKRGRSEVSGSYQIDHIKSIRDCFLEGISPEKAASLENLQFITTVENLERRTYIKVKKEIVMLFGNICSGKTTLATTKYKKYEYIKVSDIVKELSGGTSRQELQDTGTLDKDIARRLESEILNHSKVVLDGVRQPSIVELLIRKLGKSYNIEMVWLDTPLEECKTRFYARERAADSKDSFEDAILRDDTLGLNFIPLLYKDKLRYETTKTD